ncbi:MAG: hypothetical protein KGY80_05260 [Candidatus Thorarchaeota archaeon]|nr:hypothetical protein [Candidatus Thorarchaeota archaeon]
MNTVEDTRESDHTGGFVRARLSKLELPEVCPVCMEQADDLVPITAYEREGIGQLAEPPRSAWRTGKKDIGPDLQSIRGALILWIPCCAAHCNVRSDREKHVGLCGFLLLVYPLIYIWLGIISAIGNEGPLLPPITGLLIIIVILIFLGVYSFFPRALERAFRIQNINRTSDYVILGLSNKEYLAAVMEQNQMYAERLGKNMNSKTK